MKLKRVSKSFNKQKILDNVTFSFSDSKIVGLIGKNGAGKTTLMKIMNGNITNFSGTVDYNNNEKISYLIEHPKLYENKSGLYNLKYFSRILGSGYDEDFVKNIINTFNMNSFINKKAGKYSMGMKQKLAIAVSLVNKPNYLILDEPTNGMDPDGSIDILKSLQSLSNKLNIKVLISSHKLEDIELICDRAIFLKDTKLIKDISLKSSNNKNSFTKIIVKKHDYNKSLQVLKENTKILEAKYQKNEIFIDLVNDYSLLIEKLSNQKIYPIKIIDSKKSLRDTYFNINEEVK
ncbi:ABC transporter ATP-binding protein [Staphylococcus warneri]|nr:MULTISPECIES: ABC transporter ATP-binding protein [Staphylococcus]MDS3984241.1 ABC transporter ATP-binding protein [Staphylococcus capitis]MDS3997884.1 ABC transporter ATP-binding protein [Staphylococcus capitis]PTI58464.1 ABC transporter ATP-binding protein [Staphylococcus warneri]